MFSAHFIEWHERTIVGVLVMVGIVLFETSDSSADQTPDSPPHVCLNPMINVAYRNDSFRLLSCEPKHEGRIHTVMSWRAFFCQNTKDIDACTVHVVNKLCRIAPNTTLIEWLTGLEISKDGG